MRIIERYIFKEFIKSLLYCEALFIFLYIMADLFNYIDEMIRSRVAISTVLAYYANFVPSIFVQVTPIAVLLSTVYVLSALNRHNEITALRVSGISLWKIIRPLLAAGFILSILVFLVNDKLVPQSLAVSSQIKKKEIHELSKKNKAENKSYNNIAIYSSKNRMIYVRSFDAKENLLNEIIILDHDENQNIKSKSSALKAKWEEGKWVFYDFTTYNLDSAGNIIGNPSFLKKKTVDMEETPEDFKRLEWRTEFMNYRELKNYIGRFSTSGLKTARQLFVDLYYKVSFSFISLIVIIVASPIAILPHRERGGLLIGIGISILVTLSYYAVSGICLALGKAGMIPSFISAWLANIIFLALGIYLMWKRR